MDPSPIDFDAALRNPPAVFSSPEEVLAHPELSIQQKIDILKQWECDVRDELVAADQGMPGGHDGMLRRILLTLEQVGAGGFDAGDG